MGVDASGLTDIAGLAFAITAEDAIEAAESLGLGRARCARIGIGILSCTDGALGVLVLVPVELVVVGLAGGFVLLEDSLQSAVEIGSIRSRDTDWDAFMRTHLPLSERSPGVDGPPATPAMPDVDLRLLKGQCCSMTSMMESRFLREASESLRGLGIGGVLVMSGSTVDVSASSGCGSCGSWGGKVVADETGSACEVEVIGWAMEGWARMEERLEPVPLR